jgi:hypothetical protein
LRFLHFFDLPYLNDLSFTPSSKVDTIGVDGKSIDRFLVGFNGNLDFEKLIPNFKFTVPTYRCVVVVFLTR